MATRRTSVRTYLVLLVLAAVLPALALAAVLVLRSAAEERGALERGLRDTARAMAIAVDRDLSGSLRTLQALATSAHLQAGLAEYHRDLTETVKRQDAWRAVVLASPAGQGLLDTRLDLGGLPPPVVDDESFRDVVRTGQPAIGGLVRDPLSAELAFTVHAPVLRGPRVQYVLTAVVSPAAMRTVLARQQLPGDWTGIVFDGARAVVASSGDPARETGLLASVPAVPGAGALEGWVQALEADGVRSYLAYSRSWVSGWGVALAVPAATVEASLRRSLVIMTSGALLLVAVGLVVASAIGTRLIRPLVALAGSAPAASRGETLPEPVGSPSEIAEVARALAEAGRERRSAEMALRASEEQLRLITDAAPVFLVYLDPDRRYRFVNRPYAERYRRSPDEVVGATMPDVVGDRRYEPIRPALDAAFEGRVQRVELDVDVDDEDEVRRDLVQCVPDVGPGGHVRGVVVAITDITARRRAEHERDRLLAREQIARAEAEAAATRAEFLADASRTLSASLESEATLAELARLAVPAIADWCGVFVVTAEGAIRTVAVAHAEPDTERLGRELLGRYPVKPAGKYGVPNVLRTGQPELYETLPDWLVERVTARDDDRGRIRGLRLRSAMVVPLVVRGTVLGAITFFTAESGRGYDATDLALAEELARRAALAVDNARLYEAAHLAERRARFLAETSRTLAASLDYETTIRRVAWLAVPALADWCVVHMLEDDGVIRRLATAHAEPALAPLAEEFQGRQPTIDARSPTSLTAAVLRDRKPLLIPEVTESWLAARFEAPEQRARVRELDPRSVMIVPLLARGRTLGTLTFVRRGPGRHYGSHDLALAEDLASRTALAVDNARLYRAAETASRAKDEFLATLSHELRTPLNAILGWVTVLRAGAVPPETAARGLETIERSTRVQAELIADLLDVSRIIAGKLQLDVRPVNLADVIEAAREAVRTAAEAKEITVEAPGAGRTLLVSGDPARLQQIVWNLISNAVKFTPPGGRVEVTLDQAGREAVVCVRDTGQGIPAEALPHVFERFWQGDSRTTRAHGGLGLGLAIVRHLVELHGGTVAVASDGPGRGATFSVQLPLLAVTSGNPPVDAPPSFAGQKLLAGLDVLVVDDDADARDVLVLALQQQGAGVVTAASAAEALAALDGRRFDTLVADIAMPGVDGYALIRRVRERGEWMPSVAVTAHARREDRQAALAEGFDVHLSKPVEPDILCRTIARLAGRQA
jgi:PAS domain S-box-containing protein